MQAQEFLAAVLPSSGHYCAVELSTPIKQHVFVQDFEELYQRVEKFSAQSKNAYFALASFTEPGTRKADNAQHMRAIFIDLDIAAEAGPKVYGSKRSAIEALHAFTASTGLDALGHPWLVDSGGGVHAYWPLSEDAVITDWLPVAEAFKRSAKAAGFKIDMTVTADAARVLRMPGTVNWKYTPTKPVVLKQRGGVFKLADIAHKLSANTPVKAAPIRALALPGTPPKPKGKSGTPLLGTALLQSQNSVTLFKNIMVKTLAGTGCGQIKNYVENAKSEGLEPLWRGVLSIAQKCEDGARAAIKLSSLHPYPQDRMERKLAEIKGPYACTKFDSENPGICETCAHWGKITNPLALGREVLVSVEEKIYSTGDETTDGAPNTAFSHIKRPTPPRGYSFGRNGGVYVQKKAVDSDATSTEVLLVPFDFFLVDVLQEGTTYLARFAAVRQKSVTYVVIPTKTVGSKDEVIKHLAAQNIIAAYGSGNDKNLYDYVRLCVGEAAANDSALCVPPTFGWQPDNSFAVSDTVIQQHGQSYNFVSDRLTNIINCTTTKGTLGEWQRVIHMLQDKGHNGVVAMGAIGFASPLMQWADSGTPGMLFHLCGRESGVGKSLALELCASIWGDPSNFPVKPTTSDRTMLQRAGLLGNLPLLVDEITNKSRKSNMEWLPEFVFDFAQGGHKLKGSGASNTELTNDLYWRSIAMMTSNAPAMEGIMGARDTTSEGEARRFLEWQVNAKMSFLEAERALIPLLKTNYGAAGRKYAAWLVDNVDVAKRVLRETMEGWRKKTGAEDAERFWTAGCSAVIAGCILAGPTYANVCNIQVLPVVSFLETLVKDARSVVNNNQRTAEDVLNAYTRDFHGQFVKVGPPSSGQALFADGRTVRPDTTRGRVAGRVEYGNTVGMVDYYIEITMLKRYCAERNWGYLEFERQLSAMMPVETIRRDLLARTGGPSLRVLCLRITRPMDEEEKV